ncbi:uncharacterized protein PHACADRAFT_254471 [Phanerochaete carnosa HHB-10118-sp]|uniref:Uncharacterized protein n=1 Tax=Phanerochaete carnosa (strain HHB-10118-sp) TaxID=650164 RepID=K5WDB8_PHACS|nr:uncharacterized protein PHACADRAFT_254471 [Phanerochaete carnosa HHB-10118-sp]EKM57009.1 hypothetical protein PHACADRAFT_254471 [Phanerochaete carnosa HHB-10118-sp]
MTRRSLARRAPIYLRVPAVLRSRGAPSSTRCCLRPAVLVEPPSAVRIHKEVTIHKEEGNENEPESEGRRGGEKCKRCQTRHNPGTVPFRRLDFVTPYRP